MFDPNSLMYVTKEYENTLRDKAKKIYADDVVKTTLDSVNKELDNILLQINNRLDEISNKSTEIDVYRADIHRFIDSTSINPQELIDENITSTKSHPSIIANKQDRSEIQTYTYNNFINQKISLNSFLDININEGRMKSDKNVHSFDIALSSEETLKVIEFAITYKQKPTIIHKITNGEIKDSEDSVVVNRVFTGRFYIIRPDVTNNPDQIIVKAVVENADNDANNKDIKILDVRGMKATDGKEINTFNNIGPEFDLYFFTHDIDTVTICIGNIVPYKWLLQKDSYVTGEGQDPEYTNIVAGKLGKKYVGIDYIKSANAYILRDSNNKIYYSLDHTLTEDSIKSLDNIDYDGTNFWIKETSSLTFIHSKTETYICGNDITNIRALTIDISNIKELNNGEIIASIDNLGLVAFNKTINEFEINPFVTINGEKYDDSQNDISAVKRGINFIEIDNDKLLVFSTNNDKLQYFFIPINKNTGVYSDFAYTSELVQTTIDRFELSNPESTNIDIIKTPVGVFTLVKVNGTNGNVSFIYNLRDLTINSKSYVYNRFEVLKLFKPETNEEYNDFSIVINKIVDTSIGSFAIDEKNKLYVFDDTYIIKAITTNEVFSDKEGEESVSLGYDDKNSFIKLDPEERVNGQYFKTSTPFLNDIVDIFENTTGIFFIDKYGIYQLTSDLTVKTRYYDKTTEITDISRDEYIKSRTLFISVKDSDGESYTDVFEMSDVIKENTDEKIRYKYFDLFNGKYTKYDSESMSNSDYNYDYDTDDGIDNPLVNFNASLYVSLVDLTGSLYNTYKNPNDIISYKNNKYTFGEIDPIVEHNIKFVVDNVQEDGSIIKAEINKTPNTFWFKLQTNKYGFLKYEGFDIENIDSENISNINDIKKYKFVHTKDDKDITFADCRNQIENLLKNEIKENIEDTSVSGKNFELKYSETEANEKYKVRAFPVTTRTHGTNGIDEDIYNSPEGTNRFSKLGTFHNKLSIHRLLDILSNEENNGMKGFNSFIRFNPVVSSLTEYEYTHNFKDTKLGSFIFGNGIMYHTTENSFENQLKGYNNSFDGYVNDVIYMDDIRQTHLICCDNAIYAYASRKEQGYTFSKPLASSNYTIKLTRPDYTNTECYALNKAVNCGETTYVFNTKPLLINDSGSTQDTKFTLYKVTYDANSDIKLVSVINEGALSDRYILDLKQNGNILWLVTVDSNMSNEIIYSYNLTTKELTKVYQSDDSTKYKYSDDTEHFMLRANEINFVNFAENEKYIYISSMSGIQKINKETNNFIHVKDSKTLGLAQLNNRIYTYTRKTVKNVDSDKFVIDSDTQLISLYDTESDILYPVFIPPVHGDNNQFDNDQAPIFVQMEFIPDICVTNDGVYFIVAYYKHGQSADAYYTLFQLMDKDVETVNLVPYFNNQKMRQIHKNIAEGDQYYIDVNDHKIYKNGVIEPLDNSLMDTTITLKTITSDTTPQEGKTYYTIDGTFNELFNITSFDSNMKYYIRSGDPVYTKINKETENKPKRGVEYYILDLDGKYKFCGYNLTEFAKTLDYYTAKYSYKLANTSSKVVSGERYFTIKEPKYNVVENIGTSFNTNYDYYEDSETSITYNQFLQSFGTNKGYIIATMYHDDNNKISVAYNIISKTKKILPVVITDLYDTSVGTYVKYEKGNSQVGFGCMTDDIDFVFSSISSDTTIENLSLIELDSTKDNLESEAKDIFISGIFGGTGKIFKYAPTTTDDWNRFHQISSNGSGYNKLFNVDNDVYVITKSSDLIIEKFNRETSLFEENYHGRTFAFTEVCHKVDNVGKDDVYIIGSGDYCIYKSYNNEFIPVFENYNNNNFINPTSAMSDGKHIYIATKEGNNIYVIGNESDKEFISESSNLYDYAYRVEETTKPETGSIDLVHIYTGQSTLLLNNHFHDYYEDNEGRVCIPSYNGLLYYFDFDNDSHQIFRHTPAREDLYGYNETYTYHKYYKSIVTGEYGENITLNIDKTVFKGFNSEIDENIENAPDIRAPHMLDPDINLLPIYNYDKTNIIYTCYDNDVNKMVPVGPKQMLYDSDGVTIKHETPKFDMYIDSPYGTFGIQGNEVYLRKHYTENNARWKLINYLKTTGSEFKVIKETKTLGWILVDDRTVTKFNTETGKFDIDITVDTWSKETVTNKVKINYVNEFEDSGKLIIAHVANASEIYSDNNKKASGIQVYMRQGDHYQFVHINNSDYISTSNPVITSINETRLGIFVVYLTYPDQIDEKITKENYMNYHSYVFRINDNDNNSVSISYLSTAPDGYTWDNGGLNCYPLDLRQIYESRQDGTVVLTRQAFTRDNRNEDNGNINTQIKFWVLMRDDKSDTDSNDSYINDLGYRLVFYPYSPKTPSILTDEHPFNSQDDYTNANISGNFVNITNNDKNYLIECADGNEIDLIDNNNVVSFRNNFLGTGSKLDTTFGISLQTFDNGNLHNATVDILFYTKLKEVGDKYYAISSVGGNTNQPNNIVIGIYDPEKNSTTQITGNEFIQITNDVILKIDKDTCNILFNNLDIIEFNGNIFVYVFGRTYILNSKYLKAIETSEPVFNNKILYDLKLTIENKDIYNNLIEKTSNSNIDKFVIREVGVYDKDNTNHNSIHQYFEPHNYYNNTDGTKANEMNHRDMCKEYIEQSGKIYNKLKHKLNPSSDMLLNNNIFLKKNNKTILDLSGRNTTSVLGEIEDYISDLSNYKIDLTIYPSNVIDNSTDEPILVNTL